MDVSELKAKIRDIKDFPTEGILFKDITTLLKDPRAFKYVVDQMANHYIQSRVEIVVGIESRGFIFGGPLAHQLGAGFVPVRKLGKLPAKTIEVEYELEYGRDALAIHEDAIRPGQRVLIADDLLATGGTMAATWLSSGAPFVGAKQAAFGVFGSQCFWITLTSEVCVPHW